MVYKSFTLTTFVLSLSNMSKMHLKLSISSFEYWLKILNSSALISIRNKMKINTKSHNYTYSPEIGQFSLGLHQLRSKQLCKYHLLEQLEVVDLVRSLVPLRQLLHHHRGLLQHPRLKLHLQAFCSLRLSLVINRFKLLLIGLAEELHPLLLHLHYCQHFKLLDYP